MPTPFTIHQAMHSASADAEARGYKTYRGKSGKLWCVADQETAADNIYVEGGKNSDGFGGRTISFPLTDGGEVSLKGPWKASADPLFEDTGVDVRDTYTSRGIVARHRINSIEWNGADFYVGVLHEDSGPVLGTFDRIDQIARKLANELGEPVVFASITKGGGHAGTREPSTSVSRSPENGDSHAQD